MLKSVNSRQRCIHILYMLRDILHVQTVVHGNTKQKRDIIQWQTEEGVNLQNGSRGP